MQYVRTRTSRTLFRFGLAACGFFAVPALAAEPTASTNSSRLAISVTVIHSAGSPQTQAVKMSCLSHDGQVKCWPRVADGTAAAESGKRRFAMGEELQWF